MHTFHTTLPIRRRLLSAMLAMATLLSACGGGGGGGSTTVVTPVPDPVSLPKTWTGAALIESNDVGNVDAPQIAVNASGNAIAVWSQYDGIRGNIWANRYTPGTGWGTAVLIETNNAGEALYPQIAIDASGNAIAVWEQYDGSADNIWTNRYTPAGGWGTAALLETDPGDANSPQIALDASGNAIAVWQETNGGVLNVWARRYTPAGGWGTATLLETNATFAAFDPKIALDANGNALAVWIQSNGAQLSIWANRFTPTGGWGTATLIETNDSGPADDPKIAMNASGHAMVVWQQRSSTSGSSYNIWANRYSPSTGWGTAELLEGLSGDADQAQIALDTNGNAIAVWAQTDGTRYNIWTSRFTSADGWGTAALLETDNTGVANPQIAFDASGNAFAVWEQQDGAHYSIWARRYTSTSGWGTAVLLETNTDNRATYPQIAMDANGNALAVWSQSNGTQPSIWANVYR